MKCSYKNISIIVGCAGTTPAQFASAVESCGPGEWIQTASIPVVNTIKIHSLSAIAVVSAPVSVSTTNLILHTKASFER